MSETRPTLAVVILTLNEEDHIRGCIEAARNAEPDEVLVIDAASTDRTRERAAAAGARVVEQPWLGYVAQRNLAWEKTAAEWLFFVDADERVTPELGAELRAWLLRADRNGAVVRCRAWLWGRPLRCFSPGHILRVGRRGAARFVGGHVHEALSVDGKAARLKHALLHRSWNDLAEGMAKNQRYAELMAKTAAQGGRRFRIWMLAKPLWVFVKYLVLRGGIFEGRRALLYTLTTFVYGLQKLMFLLEADVQASVKRVPFPGLEEPPPGTP